MGSSMIHQELHRLLNFAVQQGLIGDEDRVYAGNQLAGMLGILDFDPEPVPMLDERLDTPTPILEILLDDAVRRGFLGNTTLARDSFDTRLMNCLTPRPSEVIANFWADYDELPDKATEAFYRMGIASNYIRKDRMARNEQWNAATPYGDLSITINMSKPEKDPRDIAAAGRRPAGDAPHNYPACLLCRQNEGFYGTGSHPARHTLRLIPLLFRGERWFFQYSPYGYYNEHCIVLKEHHSPMRISRETFDNMLQFLCLMPHYMIGSNADLPIVGGSILSHDHYQGGRHVFPMDLARAEKTYRLKDFPDVETGRLCWPLSTLRLRSKDKRPLVDAAAHILEVWRGYSNPEAGIFAATGSEPHNTITPVARMRGNEFELDLVLRNNRTTREHPLGLFHPHADVHHIKKENIGVIEVLGLAILPPRLKTSLTLLAEAWRAGRDSVAAVPELEPHARWYAELRSRHAGLAGSEDDAETLLRQEVGNVFLRVLEDCGVFARTPEGAAQFDGFAAEL